MSARAGKNVQAIRKTARRLRAEERTDELVDPLLELLHTSAELADLVSSDDPINDVPIYARQKVLSAHAAMLGQLAELVGPVRSDGAFEAFLKEISTPTGGVPDDDRL